MWESSVYVWFIHTSAWATLNTYLSIWGFKACLHEEKYCNLPASHEKESHCIHIGHSVQMNSCCHTQLLYTQKINILHFYDTVWSYMCVCCFFYLFIYCRYQQLSQFFHIFKNCIIVFLFSWYQQYKVRHFVTVIVFIYFFVGISSSKSNILSQFLSHFIVFIYLFWFFTNINSVKFYFDALILFSIFCIVFNLLIHFAFFFFANINSSKSILFFKFYCFYLGILLFCRYQQIKMKCYHSFNLFLYFIYIFSYFCRHQKAFYCSFYFIAIVHNLLFILLFSDDINSFADIKSIIAAFNIFIHKFILILFAHINSSRSGLLVWNIQKFDLFY